MNRPLVVVVVLYGIGLLLAEILHPPLAVLIGATSLLLVLLVILGRYRKQWLWLLLIAVAWTNSAIRTSWVAPTDLRMLAGNDAQWVTVRGTLAETPHLKITEHEGEEIWRSAVRVRVREISQADGVRPATGEVLATTPGVLGPEFFAGQPVEISGALSPPPGPLAEGLFDYQDYLTIRGIHFQLRAAATNAFELLSPHLSKPPLTDRFLTWSRATLALGLPVEDEPLRLLWAMTLGWRTAFTGDIDEPFLQAGTMHLFAIDGLRIALLSGIILALLRVARLSRAWSGGVAVPLIWFYTAATGWEASAVRASVMMTIVLGGWALKRPSDLGNSLAAAAFLILVADPRQFFQAGFQLSFFVMLTIAIMLPAVNSFFEQHITRLIRPDPFLPEELVPGWRKQLLPWARRGAQLCGVSFAAWAGSLPLAAKYFHLFSPVSTLANLPAVPLGTLALIANLGSLICGHWLPWITVLFNHAAWFLMVAMTWVSVQFAALPGAYFYVPAPSVTTIVIYYAVLFAAFSGWFTTARRKILGGTVLAVIAAAYGWQWQASRTETDLTVLGLDGGHVVYVDADGCRNDWLINCGNEDAVAYPLKDFLHAQGVNHLPRLVLTGANKHDCGGARKLDGVFHIGDVYTSGAKFRSPAYRDAVAAFEGPGVSRHKFMAAGDTNGCWQMLFPVATEAVAKADDAALVLLGNIHGTRLLLLSDLSRSGQSELLAQTNDLRADIVVAGLPEAGEPLCAALIAAIEPRVVVIADSAFPASRRASRALKERLARTDIPVIYTREAGGVKINAGPAGWRLQTMDGQRYEGKPQSATREQTNLSRRE